MTVKDRIDLPTTEYAYKNQTGEISYVRLIFPDSHYSVKNGKDYFENLLFFKVLFYLAVPGLFVHELSITFQQLWKVNLFFSGTI